MIPAGTDAPGFELPGLVDGAHRRVALDEFLGQDVVILAFYPADFNPACDGDSGLDELDLFTMQKDVEVLAIGPDTLYSHEAFADEYDLHVPLLSDTSHDVAETYGVAFEDDVGQRLSERAVFVVDHDGVIQYAWSTRDVEELPRSDEIKDAIADTGGDDTAFARYRIGHAHYTEGRRAFTSAMGSYRSSEWMVAQSDFRRAREEFEEAADHFDSAARFVDDETFAVYYERAQQKATALWQAADWLSKSASEYSGGRGAEGQRLREDAERPLETARDLGEPVDPDEWPPDDGGDSEPESALPRDEASDSALRIDIDDEGAADDDDGEPEPETGGGEETDDTEIDDAELEEISAELSASQPADLEGEALEETPTSMVDAPPERSTDPAAASGDSDEIDDGDEIDDADLKQLEAEMAASQSAAEEANRSESGGDLSDADGPGGPSPGERDDDASAAGNGIDDSLLDGVGADAGDEGQSTGDGPADPHADLASGGSAAPGASRSLEPTGTAGNDEDVVLDDEPQGASDEDLADIPTAEDLAAEDESADETADESGEADGD